jgi:hypothetical protein
MIRVVSCLDKEKYKIRVNFEQPYIVSVNINYIIRMVSHVLDSVRPKQEFSLLS